MSQPCSGVSSSTVSVRRSPRSPEMSAFCVPLHRRTATGLSSRRHLKQAYKAFAAKFTPTRVRVPSKIQIQIPSVRIKTPSIHVRVSLRLPIPRPHPRSWSSFSTSKRFLRKAFNCRRFTIPSYVACGGRDMTPPASIVISASSSDATTRHGNKVSTPTFTPSDGDEEKDVIDIAPSAFDMSGLQRIISNRTGQELLIEGERPLVYAVSSSSRHPVPSLSSAYMSRLSLAYYSWW
jgi:hypothetical protein